MRRLALLVAMGFLLIGVAATIWLHTRPVPVADLVGLTIPEATDKADNNWKSIAEISQPILGSGIGDDPDFGSPEVAADFTVVAACSDDGTSSGGHLGFAVLPNSSITPEIIEAAREGRYKKYCSS